MIFGIRRETLTARVYRALELCLYEVLILTLQTVPNSNISKTFIIFVNRKESVLMFSYL